LSMKYTFRWKGVAYSPGQGGRKYGPDSNAVEKWTGDDVDGKRQEKEEASSIFKRYWRRCTSDETYLHLKQNWIKAKEYQRVAPVTAKASS
jgi:Domain of unknown function (DUF4385)